MDLREVAPVHAHQPVAVLVLVGEYLRLDVLARLHALHVSMPLCLELPAARPCGERAPRHGIKLRQLLQHARELIGRDVQRGAEHGDAARHEVAEMVFKRRTDLVLPWRIVELLHLREPAFAQVARSASKGIELANLGEHAFDLRHVRLCHHDDVGN